MYSPYTLCSQEEASWSLPRFLRTRADHRSFEVKIPNFPPCAQVLHTSQGVPYAHLGSCFTSSYNLVSSALYRLGYPWIAHVLVALNMLRGKYIHDLSPDILVTPHPNIAPTLEVSSSDTRPEFYL